MCLPWRKGLDKRSGNSLLGYLVTIFTLLVFSLILPVSSSLATSAPEKTTQTNKTSILRAKAKKRLAQKKRSRKRATVRDSKPLMKVIPLGNGDYLLRPIDKKAASNETPEAVPARGPLADSSSPDAGLQPLPNPSPPEAEPRSDEDVGPKSAPPAHDGEAKGKNYYRRFCSLLLASAKQLLGAPYCYGGISTVRGMDCSGFVQKVFAKFGIELPRSSQQQANVGMLVTDKYDLSKLHIGDVLFFRRSPASRQIGHTGIYIGEGKMIHAARGNRQVTISSVERPYYQRTFVAAKRFFIFFIPQSSNI